MWNLLKSAYTISFNNWGKEINKKIKGVLEAVMDQSLAIRNMKMSLRILNIVLRDDAAV
ncbi:hypothetical protein PVA17_01920 [Lysinibacillus sp. CNPSo 3705]|uniref:hypothetical protein n=1 Tax=Lysinibacillus sp. CNPSo 3705 TaxID=3028148 RepID=UPI0023647D63|nr:hypothetical protein [Lysinibacillus sp. CNPSo 3705]MDD1501530.1 hypothetical protein [Lysinibacillus sp. CNPSo 3705]